MISEKLKKVILKELELDDFDIQDETLASQVPGWDSLSHVNVIVAIEREFKIRFKSSEILKFRNIGEMQQMVNIKTATP